MGSAPPCQETTLGTLRHPLGTDLTRKGGLHDTGMIACAGPGVTETDATRPENDGCDTYRIIKSHGQCREEISYGVACSCSGVPHGDPPYPVELCCAPPGTVA